MNASTGDVVEVIHTFSLATWSPSVNTITARLRKIELWRFKWPDLKRKHLPSQTTCNCSDRILFAALEFLSDEQKLDQKLRCCCLKEDCYDHKEFGPPCHIPVRKQYFRLHSKLISFNLLMMSLISQQWHYTEVTREVLLHLFHSEGENVMVSLYVLAVGHCFASSNWQSLFHLHDNIHHLLGFKVSSPDIGL